MTTRGRRRWRNANVPTTSEITKVAGAQKCRGCGKSLPVGALAKYAPFAIGGMFSCTDHDFYAAGEPQ